MMYKDFLRESRGRIVMLVSLLLLAVVTFAVPAKPGLTRVLTLTDGTTVNATLVGDEYGHFWRGADGKSYQMVAGTDTYQEVNSQDIVQYAQQRRAQANQRRMKRLAPHRGVGNVGSISGEKKGLIILVNFTDVTFQDGNNNALYQRIANEENFTYTVNSGDKSYSFKGSMYDYFKAQSEGDFLLSFDVVGPVTVSKTQAYYGENENNTRGNDKHPAAMVIEAINLAHDLGVNFANYDWNNDKEVDQVYVVYAGKGEADGGAADTIWPHEWTLSSANYYGDGEGAQTLDDVKIDTYACGGELNGKNVIAGIGTMCHEFSHCLGYPDFYDTDYSGGQGMGYWDLMCSGSYNDNGYQPAGYTSYERWVAGWKTPVELVNTQTISNMAALQTNGSNTYVIYNKGNNNEYYLLENRQKTGWDASLPGAGLLILHVDYDAKAWKDNKPNDERDHQRMTWIPADNEYQKDSNSNVTFSGMKNDPFPYGTVNAFGKNTTPAATLYNNNSDGTKYLDCSIVDITQNNDGTISFNFNGESNMVPVDPYIYADESLTFSTTVGTPQTIEFEVLSEGLTDDITLTLTDANNVFSLGSNTISKTLETATVDVTFTPTTAGTYTGSITLTSEGAETVTVQLSGTATEATSISDETIDFTAQNYSNEQAISSLNGTNCTITFDKGTNSNAPKYYTSGTAIRLYGGNTMTIASTTKTITKIEITFGSDDGSNAITTDVVSYSNGTWTGSASSVTFTVGGTSGNRRIKKVKVTYADNGSGGTDPVIPALAYYKNADGKQGSALKTAMCGIIYNRTEKSYDYLWTAFQTTDVRSDGKIWDMYSNATNYTPVTSGSSYSKEGDSYNREHSWPQSWFDSNAPMYTDLHHIYPTDGFVNGKRANYPFGETSNPTYTSANDFSKLGPCSYSGYTGTVFEPADEYKGDFARTYFYMVTCYEEKLHDWYTNYSSTDVVNVIDGSTYPGFQTWQLNMLMEWAKNDPVSEKEINRNNAVYAIQANRNPFIDYPGLEEYVWGTLKTTAFSYDNYVQPEYNQEPPTAPTGLALSDVTSTSMSASWTAVADATSYDIDVVKGTSFEASAGEPVLQSNFSSTTGWTLSGTDTYTGTGFYGNASPSIKFDSTGDYAISPDFGSGVKLQFWAYGNGGTGSTFKISGLVNGSWQDIETVTIAQGGDTYEVNLPAGTSQVKFYFTKSVNCALDDVVVYGPGSSPEAVDGYPKSVGNVTSYDVTDLTSGTQYAVRVRAVNDAGNSDWSSAVTATTTIPNSAPVWSSLPTPSTTLGGEDIELTISEYVTGYPTPEITLASTTASSAYYDFDENDGYFTFTPSAIGTFTFTFTATNSEGSANATLTVTVGNAAITVPTLDVDNDNVTATTAPVSWDACDGVSSYTLQLASDDQFTTGGSGSQVTLFNNAATSSTAPTDWTYNISNSSSSYLILQKDHYVVTEAFDASSCTELSLSQEMRTYGGTDQPSITVQYSTDNGSTWSTSLGTLSAANSTMAKRTIDISAVAGCPSVRLRIASTSTSTSVGVGIKNIVLTGTESAKGSIISTQTVNGTSYTFTGLTPYTVYYARVKGNSDWSNVEEFITDVGQLVLANNGNNSDAINAVVANGGKYDVTLSGRTLTKNDQWNTLCLPFDVTIASSPLAGATVKKLNATNSNLTAGTLTLTFDTESTTMTAGTPYIIKWESGDNITNPVFSGVTITSAAPTEVESADGKVKFVGQYDPFTIGDKSNGTFDGDLNEILFVGSNSQIGYSAVTRTLKCFRAHFWVKPNGDGSSSASSFVLDFGEESTGIREIETYGTNEANGPYRTAWYTLDGRKLSGKPTAKGLYIHGGRKTVIK